MIFFTTIKEWLDEYLWLLIGAFFCLYAFGWILLWTTLAVDFIFSKKTNNVEEVAGRIYPFCHNLCRYTLLAGAGFIVFAIMLGYIVPLFLMLNILF